MKNNADWQRHSDDCVSASHKSRLRKEKALQDKKNKINMVGLTAVP